MHYLTESKAPPLLHNCKSETDGAGHFRRFFSYIVYGMSTLPQRVSTLRLKRNSPLARLLPTEFSKPTCLPDRIGPFIGVRRYAACNAYVTYTLPIFSPHWSLCEFGRCTGDFKFRYFVNGVGIVQIFATILVGYVKLVGSCRTFVSADWLPAGAPWLSTQRQRFNKAIGCDGEPSQFCRRNKRRLW